MCTTTGSGLSYLIEAIRQNADRFRAKRAPDMDFVCRDVGQIQFWDRAHQRKRIGPPPRQSSGG
jgi:hypothetical protein